MEGMTISQLIEKLQEIQEQRGDLPLGYDCGQCISWLEHLEFNTAYDYDKEIDFVELVFDYQ